MSLPAFDKTTSLIDCRTLSPVTVKVFPSSNCGQFANLSQLFIGTLKKSVPNKSLYKYSAASVTQTVSGSSLDLNTVNLQEKKRNVKLHQHFL